MVNQLSSEDRKAMQDRVRLLHDVQLDLLRVAVRLRRSDLFDRTRDLITEVRREQGLLSDRLKGAEDDRPALQ